MPKRRRSRETVCPGCGKKLTEQKEASRWTKIKTSGIPRAVERLLCPSCGPLVTQFMEAQNLPVISLRKHLETALGRKSWWTKMVATRAGHRG